MSRASESLPSAWRFFLTARAYADRHETRASASTPCSSRSATRPLLASLSEAKASAHTLGRVGAFAIPKGQRPSQGE